MNATWILETGNGSSPLWVHYNNAGGIKVNGVYHKYDSKEQGYKALETLIKEYYDYYGNDLKSMREHYCQCGEEDYSKFMQILEQERSRLNER